jgi:hypothetical protein
MTPSPPSPTATIPLKETSGGGLAVKTGSPLPQVNSLFFCGFDLWTENLLVSFRLGHSVCLKVEKCPAG